MITLTRDELTVTPRGRPLLRNICMVFDRYMQDSPQPNLQRPFTGQHSNAL